MDNMIKQIVLFIWRPLVVQRQDQGECWVINQGIVDMPAWARYYIHYTSAQEKLRNISPPCTIHIGAELFCVLQQGRNFHQQRINTCFLEGRPLMLGKRLDWTKAVEISAHFLGCRILALDHYFHGGICHPLT